MERLVVTGGRILKSSRYLERYEDGIISNLASWKLLLRPATYGLGKSISSSSESKELIIYVNLQNEEAIILNLILEPSARSFFPLLHHGWSDTAEIFPSMRLGLQSRNPNPVLV